MLLTSHSLLAHGIETDMDEGERIAHTISTGNLNQINQLFEQGLSVNQDIEREGTPLIIAVQADKQELVSHFLNMGADINLESRTDGNPLIVAALANNLGLVKYLHQNGATLDSITKYDETALISASRAGHFKVVQYLVENGADVNLSVMANVRGGKQLRSPLNGAKTSQIRDYLISQGAKI